MDLVLRAAVMFMVLFVLMRIVGRRELHSLEPFDVILLVVMGDLVAQSVTQSDHSVTGGVIVVATMGLLSVAISYVTFRVPRLRPLLDGEPILIVSNGEPLERNLRRERITIEELQAEARLQQLGSLESVRYAVLETSGRISFVTD